VGLGWVQALCALQSHPTAFLPGWGSSGQEGRRQSWYFLFLGTAPNLLEPQILAQALLAPGGGLIIP
jgi:hypothetical protein